MPEAYGVFEGGGVRGTALVGAVAAAEERGITFRAVAGTSAGAIVAAALAAGYNASEMRTLLTEKNFQDFMDPVSVFGLRKLLAYWRLGLYKGEAFHRWIGEVLSLKVAGQRHRSPCFKDLPKPLTVVAADLVHQRAKVFSRSRSPDMIVADAVRMSMSIPFFFQPVPSGSELLVDGGILSNFPAWVFREEQRRARLPVLGFRLVDDVPPPRIRTLLDLAKALASTVVAASVEIQLEVASVRDLHLIELLTLGVRTTDFGITPERKDQLYQQGYLTALKWFNDNGW